MSTIFDEHNVENTDFLKAMYNANWDLAQEFVDSNDWHINSSTIESLKSEINKIAICEFLFKNGEPRISLQSIEMMRNKKNYIEKQRNISKYKTQIKNNGITDNIPDEYLNILQWDMPTVFSYLLCKNKDHIEIVKKKLLTLNIEQIRNILNTINNSTGGLEKIVYLFKYFKTKQKKYSNEICLCLCEHNKWCHRQIKKIKCIQNIIKKMLKETHQLNFYESNEIEEDNVEYNSDSDSDSDF